MVELLIFLGIFAFTSAAFITVLLTVTRVQVRQASVVDVSEQSQFLLQQMQYYIEKSSLIDIPQDTPTSTLKLWTGVNAQDPTYITLASGTVYLQQTATGTLQALSSNKVTVSSLTFTRRANVPSHDSVSISFTLAYNTSNIEQAFSQMLQTSIARVSAATFDSNILPSSTATYSLGASGQIWSSINQSIYFSGANVGIGTASPANALDVNGAEAIGTYAGGTTAPTSSLIVSGNVGIGNASPTQKLDIAHDSSQALDVVIGNISGHTYNGNIGFDGEDQYPAIFFRATSTIKDQFLVNANTGDLYLDAPLSFRIRNAINGGSTIFFVSSTLGYVGIGTATPAAALEVNGNAMVDTGGSANHAVCWKADGKTLGYCSAIATSTGVCTCN